MPYVLVLNSSMAAAAAGRSAHAHRVRLQDGSAQTDEPEHSGFCRRVRRHLCDRITGDPLVLSSSVDLWLIRQCAEVSLSSLPFPECQTPDFAVGGTFRSLASAVFVFAE